MTLLVSGQISLNQVITELNLQPGAPILSPAGTHYKVEFINT